MCGAYLFKRRLVVELQMIEVFLLACIQQEASSLQTGNLDQSISATEVSVRQAQEYQKKIIVEEFTRYSDHFQS